MNKILLSIAFGVCYLSNMAHAAAEAFTIINNTDIQITARIGNGWWSWCNQVNIPPGKPGEQTTENSPNQYTYKPEGGCANLPLKVTVWADGYLECLNAKDYQYIQSMTLRVDKLDTEKEKKLECFTIKYVKQPDK